jgi:hypothetical protein
MDNIKKLRIIIMSLPAITQKQHVFLTKHNIIISSPSQLNLLQLENDEENNDLPALNEDLVFKILEQTTEITINEKQACNILFNSLKLLAVKLIYNYKLSQKPKEYLIHNVYTYLLASSTHGAHHQLNNFMLSLWQHNPHNLIYNDFIINFLINNRDSHYAYKWIKLGYCPYTLSSNGTTWIGHLKQTANYPQIDNILSLMIVRNLHEPGKALPANLYQNILFIYEQLQYLNNQHVEPSAKLFQARKELFLPKNINLIVELRDKNKYKINQWLLDKLITLLTSKETVYMNRMLELGVFTERQHSYLSYNAIVHGANPLNCIIQAVNNNYVSFLEVLTSEHRTAEIAQIFAYYITTCQQPTTLDIPQQQFNQQLAKFIIEKYEHTPANAEELLLQLFKNISKVATPELINEFASLKLNLLYPIIFNNTEMHDIKLAHFFKVILSLQENTASKVKAIRLLESIELQQTTTLFAYAQLTNPSPCTEKSVIKPTCDPFNILKMLM